MCCHGENHNQKLEQSDKIQVIVWNTIAVDFDIETYIKRKRFRF